MMEGIVRTLYTPTGTSISEPLAVREGLRKLMGDTINPRV